MKQYRNIIIDMFADPSPAWAGGGISTSNSYVINAYGNTVETSGNDFTPEKAIFYNKTFMKNHTARLVHGQFGEKMTMPKHSGNIVNIRGMSPYPTAKTPLQEGVTPPGNTMDFYYVEIPVYQYGKFTPITDYAEFASRDDILIHDAEELSSQSGRTLEEIDVDVLNGGTEVMYAPAVASDGTVTEVNTRAALTALSKFSVLCVFRAVTHLEIQNAETIGDSYVAIIHPNVKYDVMTSEGFISIVKYNNAERLFKGEIGMIGNVRFVVSSMAKVFTAAGAQGKDVYSTLVLGKDAYKVIEIEGQGMHTIIKALGSGGTADPLDQRATQGWKTTHGIGITCETSMVRVESCSGSNLKTQYAGVSDNWKRMKDRMSA